MIDKSRRLLERAVVLNAIAGLAKQSQDFVKWEITRDCRVGSLLAMTLQEALDEPPLVAAPYISMAKVREKVWFFFFFLTFVLTCSLYLDKWTEPYTRVREGMGIWHYVVAFAKSNDSAVWISV
jgi:hypothetical protein